MKDDEIDSHIDYQCQTCGIVCKNQRELKKHTAVHIPPTAHQWKICKKNFQDARALKIHNTVIHVKKKQQMSKRKKQTYQNRKNS